VKRALFKIYKEPSFIQKEPRLMRQRTPSDAGKSALHQPSWKIGKLENWKIGELENWKIGKLVYTRDFSTYEKRPL